MEIELKLYGSSKILSTNDTLLIKVPDNSNIKELRQRLEKLITEKFDLIINATYEGINEHILKDKIYMEYNLQEMCKLSINTKRFGSTILDGKFPSILPIAGKKNQYLFAHVTYSQLLKIKSKKFPQELLEKKIPSQISLTMEKSKKYMKILDDAKLIGNFRVVRAVNIDKKTDSRKSEIIYHQNGNLSIFSGKIITVEKIGRETVFDVLNFCKLKESRMSEPSALKEELMAFGSKNEISFGNIMKTLRLCLVGNLSGPDLFKIIALIGSEETLNRIESLTNKI